MAKKKRDPQIVDVAPEATNEPTRVDEQAELAGFALVVKPAIIRAEASNLSAHLIRVPIHARIKVLEAGEEWCKARYGGKVGYILTESLERG